MGIQFIEEFPSKGVGEKNWGAQRGNGGEPYVDGTWRYNTVTCDEWEQETGLNYDSVR